MPELPDLEAIVNVLSRVIVGQRVEEVEVGQPLTIRRPLPEFVALLEGNTFRQVARRGKFLLFTFDSGHVLAINLMLSGRLQYCTPRERKRAKTCFIFHLSGDQQLRYFDPRLMGKVYLVEDGRLDLIPRFTEMGPEALGEEVTLEVFRERLRRHPGQIKNILVNDTFLAGIGNAYADETLFEARINPYRKRPSLSPAEVEALYRAMRSVLTEAMPIVAARMGDDISLKIRDFLKVHDKGGQPCPRCGSTISQIQANQRLTNFCRSCQK